MSRSGEKHGLTLAVIGCGNLGIAILSGILSHLASIRPDALDSVPIHHFLPCVTRPESVERIRREVGNSIHRVGILQNENVKGAQVADVVLLGCKPYQLKTVLHEEGMREALAGKLVISILAGVPVQQIEDTLYGEGTSASPSTDSGVNDRCRVVRVMPNTASLISQSMTVIAKPDPPLSEHQEHVVSWMFERIGRVVYLPPAQMDVSTALCGSGPAFCALILEALADGAVAMGLSRADAQMMAAQTMAGAAGLVLNGEHPAILKDKVSSPGGCTIGGLLVLEEGTVRGTVARGVREATVVASQLGKGVQGVNGTRF